MHILTTSQLVRASFKGRLRTNYSNYTNEHFGKNICSFSVTGSLDLESLFLTMVPSADLDEHGSLLETSLLGNYATSRCLQ